MDIIVVFPLYGSFIVAAAFLLMFMFDIATCGLSGETMEIFANEYTIYFAAIFAFVSIGIALLTYKSIPKNKKTSGSGLLCGFVYVSWTACLFFFLCTVYIWVIWSIWNLLEFLGMGFIVFCLGFPISAIIYLLIGAAVLIPFAACLYCYFGSDNKIINGIVAPIVPVISSVIYCYVMNEFEFFSYLTTSCSSLFN